jgi:hypothetical protein
VFDLPIPGWLPPSQDFATGDLGACTQYFLHARVKFLVVEDHSTTAWSFTTLCSPFRSRSRTLETHKCITLRRFVEPPTDEPMPPALINYLLTPPTQPSTEGLTIPSDIVSKIQVLASVPTHIDVREDRLPFTLRLRTEDLEDDHCKRLQVTAFTIDVEQRERCRLVLLVSLRFDSGLTINTCRRVADLAEYESRYPVPSQGFQPPNRPLFSAHHMSDMYQLGLYVAPSSKVRSMLCSTSLLPPGEPGVYQLSGDSHIFAEDAVKDAATWYTLETSVPFVQALPRQPVAEDDTDWEGALKLRPSGNSPLYDVSHSLKLSVRCSYTMPDTNEVASADLNFSIPLTFGRIAPPLPPRDILPALFHSTRLPDGAYPPLPPLLPYGANLPAYSQLFDSQGNRKMDATPLPLYTPRASSESTDELLPSNEKQEELHLMTL